LSKDEDGYLLGCCAIALMMEAADTHETSVNVYQTTWRNNPEDSHLHIAAVITSNITSEDVYEFITHIFSSVLRTIENRRSEIVDLGRRVDLPLGT
jgi:hypothetical protein